MTTMATICGAIPLVLASGAGAGARNSIGLVIVGGMFIASILASTRYAKVVFMVPDDDNAEVANGTRPAPGTARGAGSNGRGY